MARHRATTRPVLDEEGNQIGYEQVNIPFTPEEEAEADQREAEWAAGAARRDALAQIATLEASITERRRREAILGTDNGWLANVDSQIAALRAQL